MRRLRAIEDEEARHLRGLEEAWSTLAADEADEARFAAAWLEAAAGWSFARINDLIARHNAYYGVEARVPMDPRTGGYKRSWKRAPYGSAWILERFPPVRALALEARGPTAQAPEESP